ncbi:hypothetical protein KY311_04480 [Candidatus Woesearchaeota archaeon]|nr:hypothetical protein [Candidatus Woesearchaeota archaeon]
MKLNKKASLFSVFLLIMTIAVVITAVAVISSAGKGKSEYIGANEADLFEVMNQGEKHLIYLDFASELAEKKTLYDFEANGNYSECGKLDEFYIWKSKEKQCWPTAETIQKGFVPRFVSSFNNYLLKYPGNLKFPVFSQADIILDSAKKKLFGRQLWSIKIEKLFARNVKSNINYAIKPNFIVDFEFDFDYRQISENMQHINSECSSMQDLNVIGSPELTECIETELEQLEGYSICSEPDMQRMCTESLDNNCKCGNIAKGSGESECRLNNRMFNICVDHDQEIFAVDGLKPLVTKFAYYIDDNAAPPEVEFTLDGNVVKWKSPAPDVEYYEVFFGAQGEKSDSVARAENYATELAYTIPGGTNKVSVVAVDFEGQSSERTEIDVELV